MNLLPTDEVNSLAMKVTSIADAHGGKFPKRYKEDIEDEILDLLIMSYIFGQEDANESLGTEYRADDMDISNALYHEFDGKTYVDRLNDAFDKTEEGADPADINRIIETESHRDYNAGANTTALRMGAKFKTWNTMLDDKVREEHTYLQGQKVGIDENFFTWDGYETDYPGNFGVAELDCSCRCYCTYSNN